MGWQRPLSGMERWHWLLDRAAPMNVVFVARVAGRFNRARLQRALDVAAAHYPLMTARIEPADPPRFVSCEHRVPLRALEWRPDDWRSTAVEELNQRIVAIKGPLVRAVLLDGKSRSDLLLSFHLAVADGLSGAHLLDEVLSVYGGGARSTAPAAEALDPPLETALGSPVAALLATLRELPGRYRLAPLPAHRRAPPEHRQTALLDARVPAHRIERLAERAGKRGSSVHGALVAALLLSIGAELRGRSHARRDNLGCVTPVDLRRRCELPPGMLGTLISQVVSSHRVHYDTLFWDLAADVSEQLRRATANGTALAYACLKERMHAPIDEARRARRVRRSERYNRTAAVVNNLGRLEFYSRYGDVTVERLGFLVSANVHVGTSIVLSSVTLDDTCTLNFTFAEPLVATEAAQRLVDATLSRLDEAAG
jgi:NRPS condensation-like uncharacterized protein